MEDEKHFARDPQYLKLFKGVLEHDALDPQRKAMRKTKKFYRTSTIKSSLNLSLKHKVSAPTPALPKFKAPSIKPRHVKLNKKIQIMNHDSDEESKKSGSVRQS